MATLKIPVDNEVRSRHSTARPANTGASRSLELEYEWLNHHRLEYAGNWVAILRDNLLIAHPQLDNVLEHIEGNPEMEEALVHYIP